MTKKSALHQSIHANPVIALIRFGTLIILLFCAAKQSVAQYSTFAKVDHKDWILTGSGLALMSGSTILRFSSEGYSIDNLPELSISDLPKFERRVPTLWSSKHGTYSDWLAIGALALPALALTNSKARGEMMALAHIYVQTLSLTVALTDYTKVFVRRDRPFLYGSEAPISAKIHPTARMSFPSGHTSTAAAMCFLSARTFTSYSSNKRLNALVWSTAVLYPAAVGYLRVRAGKHFITDVLAGYLLGAAVGYVIPTLQKSRDSSKN